jgi:hypothetical protein
MWLGALVAAVVLLPKAGTAQVSPFAPPVEATAGSAAWQINGEPIVVQGLTYYPTRAFRLFDGQVMVQTGFFAGVPVYSDVTIQPFVEIYVPLGNGRMRVYERRPERDFGELVTAGTGGPSLPSSAVEHALPIRMEPVHTVIVTGVLPSGDNGVWLEFEGSRWYSDGPAAMLTPDRFEPIGEYHGFPVYRDKNAGSAAIWVSVVKGGPVAPYAKR